jgi:hypothetical protein
MTWYSDIAASDVETAAKKLAGNWRSFESFHWHSDARPADAENCAIVYLSNRDADCLTQSNAAAIKDALSEFTGWMRDPYDGYKFDVEEQSHNHWAVGHVDGIVIRCIGPDGKATPAFRVLYELAEKLDTYPVLDEDDFSQRESDEADETWDSFACSEFRRALHNLAPHHEGLIDAIPVGHLRTIWRAIAEEKNLCGGPEYESNEGGAYFPFDAVFGARAPRHMRVTWPDVRRIILDVKADQHPMRLARKFDAARKTVAP